MRFFFKQLQFLLCILCSLLSYTVIAETKTNIVVNEIPNLLNQLGPEPALYNEFLALLDNTKIIFMSPARIEVEFEKDYLDCIFPASTNTMPRKGRLLQSDPVQQVQAFVFTLSSEMPKMSPETKIAIRRGFLFGGIRNTIDATFIELSTDVETLLFMQLGRADAMIGYLPDIEGAVSSISSTMPFYDKSKPIYEAADSIVCKDTPANRLFVEKANTIISQFVTTRQQNGALNSPTN